LLGKECPKLQLLEDEKHLYVPKQELGNKRKRKRSKKREVAEWCSKFHLFQEAFDLANETKQVTLGLLRHVKSKIEQPSKVVREPTAEYRTKSNSEFIDLPEEFIYIENH